MNPTRGKLHDPARAPHTGEHVDVVVSGEQWRIEQILSGRLTAPLDDVLDHTEWVVVLAGSAVLDVQGTIQTMQTGDWILLRPGVAHRVISTEPGTSWLAVHVDEPSPASAE